LEAKPHPRQEDRLKALHSFEVLDTDREKDFDDIVKLAAAICETEISVVNLIDAERQWFKAEVGLGVRETPLATSLCAHVILEEDFVEIPDTLEDPRMRDNPLCAGEPGLRFYAGALLVAEDGLPLGTLCVLDSKPKSLTSLQRDSLRVLARQVMAQMQLRRELRVSATLRKEVDHRTKNSLQSLASFVRVIQRSTPSPDAQSAVYAVLARIKAMTQLHTQLYTLDEHASVDLGTYIKSICEHLAAIAPEGVTLSVTTEPVSVKPGTAVAVGTLVFEFAANAFKHAFPNEREGRVSVELSVLADGRLRLVCADDGVGLPDDAEERVGFGSQIMDVISAELRSPIERRAGVPGLTASIVFVP